MRCKICDWSPDGAQSLFHLSLSLPRVSHSTDPETGEISCNCFDDGLEYKYGLLDSDGELWSKDVGSMEETGDTSDDT